MHHFCACSSRKVPPPKLGNSENGERARLSRLPQLQVRDCVRQRAQTRKSQLPGITQCKPKCDSNRPRASHPNPAVPVEGGGSASSQRISAKQHSLRRDLKHPLKVLLLMMSLTNCLPSWRRRQGLPGQPWTRRGWPQEKAERSGQPTEPGHFCPCGLAPKGRVEKAS